MTPAGEPPTSGPRPPRGGAASLGFLPLVLLAACCSVHLLVTAGVLAAVGAWVGQPAVAVAGSRWPQRPSRSADATGAAA